MEKQHTSGLVSVVCFGQEEFCVWKITQALRRRSWSRLHGWCQPFPACRAGPALHNEMHFCVCLDCKPWHVLCPKGFLQIAVQWSALRAERSRQCVKGTAQLWPCHAQQWASSAPCWKCSSAGRGTFGLFRCSSWICQPWCNASLDNCYGGSFFCLCSCFLTSAGRVVTGFFGSIDSVVHTAWISPSFLLDSYMKLYFQNTYSVAATSAITGFVVCVL